MGKWRSSRKGYDDKPQHFDDGGKLLFMLQQEEDMNLYSFNKVSWCKGYDNKGQHFEKWRSATESYDSKT